MNEHTASPTTPAEAGARIDALKADPKWSQALLAGGSEQVRELKELTALKLSGRNDEIGKIINGTAKVSDIETVAEGDLTKSQQLTLAAQMRESGVPDASIRQMLEGKPVSKAEYDAVAKLKADRLGDADFKRKWLSGDRAAMIEMTNIGIVLAGGFREENAT